MGKIGLTIDDRLIEVDEGMTVLEAARGAGIFIPTACDHKDLNPYGACRMCIVEIDNVRGYPTSCTTPATQGMVVRTQSAELKTLRNRILELMLSGHPNSCLVCNHREDCERYRPKPTKAGRTTRCGFCSNREECSVRQMALEADSRDLELPTLYSAHRLERDDPFMDRDYNLCILCGRCWRICEKIHGAPAISIINRGKWARIGTAFHKSHLESGCTFCGSCIDICPTGTLTDRYARWYGKEDLKTTSACTLCPEGCSLDLLTKSGRLIATRMTAFNSDSSLCAVGRFAYAQLVNGVERLTRPAVREGDELIPSDWETAILEAAKVKEHAGSLAFLVCESSSREDIHLYKKLADGLDARLVLIPSDGLMPEEVGSEMESGRIRAAVVSGNFLDEHAVKSLKEFVLIDSLPSKTGEAARVVLPSTMLSEVEGTYRNGSGQVKELKSVSLPRGMARPEWMIVRDMAKAMGLEGFDYSSVGEITREISNDPSPKPFSGNPRHNVRELPSRFRGHLTADFVRPLESLGLASTPLEPVGESSEGGFEVLEKSEVVPNMHMLKIRGPEIARFAKPGQFVIVMVKETSERTPFTLVDWSGDSITLVVEEVGRSSREAVALRKGDRIAHVAGPLGVPFPIEQKGTIVLGGGCYGIGAVYPIARAFKEAGSRVICAIEASSKYLLYMEEEIASVCDELRVATKDGSRGIKGGVQEIFADLAGQGVDMFVAVGCTFMMRMASEATKPSGIPTLVALNPIMVDGTGMCGACRVSVDSRTRFACVDGPVFDGHTVDWDELFSRRGAYTREEIEAMPQAPEKQGCGCGRK